MTDLTERSPADELDAAVYALRNAAGSATAPPWHTSLVWSPDATGTSAVYSHAHPTGTVESEVVASGRVRPGYGGIRNPHNAVWIALLSPAVAKPLIVWLEREAAWTRTLGHGIPRDLEALAFAQEINAAVKR